MTTTATATYAKLQSGAWGVRIQGQAKAGQEVTVTKRSGETKRETIAKVVWSGNGISLCAIGTATRANNASGTCDNCGTHSSRLTTCIDSSGISGLCCPTCARESQWARSFA